jgi:hypothetical protein
VTLYNSEQRDIVVVIHRGFMKHLSDDLAINLAKVGWESYTIKKDVEGGGVLILV